MPDTTCISLSELIKQLKKKLPEVNALYRKFRNWFLAIVAGQIVLGSVLCGFTFNFIHGEIESRRKMILIGIFFVLQGLIMLLQIKCLKPTLIQFRRQFTELTEIGSQIVNNVDWSTYRQREPGDLRKVEAEQALIRLSAMRDNNFFPSRNKRSHFFLLMYVYMLFSLLALSALITLSANLIYTGIRASLT